MLRYLNWMTLKWLMFIILVSLCTSCAMNKISKAPRGWSFDVIEGYENTYREYLLVKNDEAGQREKFSVGSQCSIPINTEGTYGECIHVVKNLKTNNELQLFTGEDVVLIGFTWDMPTIFATLKYGCCAGLDVASFYAIDGKYLGNVSGFLSKRANGLNIITRRFDVGNGTRYGESIYLLVDDEINTHYAIIINKDAQITRVPVVHNAPLSGDCSWYIDDFSAYGDRKDITLKLEPAFCGES